MATKSATSYVGRRAAENGFHGIRYARDIGREPNVHLSINFETVGIGDDLAGEVFRDLRSRIARRWRYLRKTNRVAGPFVDLHAHANPAGSRHVHWLMHLPAGLIEDFERVVRLRLATLAGISVGELRDAVLVVRVTTPGSLAKYIYRGVEPAYAGYLHIRPANEGLVSGRRTGVSRAISKAARKQAGWSRRASKASRGSPASGASVGLL